MCSEVYILARDSELGPHSQFQTETTSGDPGPLRFVTTNLLELEEGPEDQPELTAGQTWQASQYRLGLPTGAGLR